MPGRFSDLVPIGRNEQGDFPLKLRDETSGRLESIRDLRLSRLTLWKTALALPQNSHPIFGHKCGHSGLSCCAHWSGLAQADPADGHAPQALFFRGPTAGATEKGRAAMDRSSTPLRDVRLSRVHEM